MADDETSVFFTYVVPFVGVLLVAVGIGAAVPGGYALIQEEISDCGDPTVAVETPERTAERFGDGSGPERIQFEELAPEEQTAFTEALSDPLREAHVRGEFPNRQAFQNGTVVVYESEEYYATVVSENPCFQAAPLQFPLGVFAIGLGLVWILMPPVYRRLIEIEERAGRSAEAEG